MYDIFCMLIIFVKNCVYNIAVKKSNTKSFIEKLLLITFANLFVFLALKLL